MFCFVLVVTLNNDSSPIIMLPSATQRVVCLSGHCLLRRHVFLMSKKQRTRTLGPSGRRPMRPLSSQARPHAPLVLPGAVLRQGTQSLLVCSGGGREKMPLWPQRKGSSCEIWIEMEKQRKNTHCFHAAEPFPYPPLLIAVPTLLTRPPLNRP